jgi:deoxyadenosine/deoxycytidine kinase
MPIICLEGASAVGKTTTANFLKDNYGAFVVPEVNQLFARPENALAEWYLERHVERWAIAKEQQRSHQLVVLDGDPFQPLWYNWAYNYVDLQSLEFMRQFYQPKLENNTFDFPDLYFVLSASKTELKQHKASDASRTRSNFEKHLKLIEPQHHYFQAVKAFSSHLVYFLETSIIKANAEAVLEHISSPSTRNEASSAALFNYMAQWLRENRV